MRPGTLLWCNYRAWGQTGAAGSERGRAGRRDPPAARRSQPGKPAPVSSHFGQNAVNHVVSSHLRSFLLWGCSDVTAGPSAGRRAKNRAFARPRLRGGFQQSICLLASCPLRGPDTRGRPASGSGVDSPCGQLPSHVSGSLWVCTSFGSHPAGDTSWVQQRVMSTLKVRATSGANRASRGFHTVTPTR